MASQSTKPSEENPSMSGSLGDRRADPAAAPGGSHADLAHRVEVCVGTILAAAGIILIMGGGLIAGVITTSGYPHGLLGFGVIVAGLGVMWAGLWLAGVDLI